MITADQLICHMTGDYLLQSDWMAQNKTKDWKACLAHAFTYSLPFLLLKPSLMSFLVILGSHYIVDHWRLARYVCWAKNFLGPKSSWHPWEECQGTGYHKDSAPFLSFWLMVYADNTIHIILNGLALKYL